MTKFSHHLSSANGFQLVELLIVLAIISLIVTFSTPIYSSLIARERRTEATFALAKLALALEHYHLQHDTYQGISLNTLAINPDIAQHHYRLEIETADDLHFVVSAIPNANQLAIDTHCGSLTLNELGIKGVSGDGNTKECW